MEGMYGSAQAKLHRAVVDELVQIRKIANETVPRQNDLNAPAPDFSTVRPALEAIDGHAERAVAMLKGEG